MRILQFSQQGKRSNNEDSLGTTRGVLSVCDGMGGHNYGERASVFVKETLLKAFAEPRPLGKMEIQQQLNQVQTDLNQLLEKEPELEKMGTTFTGIFITPDVWYAAHIGDSRIYLFRTSEQKLWHTWDHSLVGELMRTKEITIEAGRFHPMSNRISKAIIAQKDGKPASASIVKIDELKKGDILLLCSDGVVEAWGDWELVKLFSSGSLNFEQKCEKLKQQCNEKSKDNNTAIIAEIEEEDAFSYGNNDELEWTTFAEVEADYKQYVKDNEEVEEEFQKQEEKPMSQLEPPVSKSTRKPFDMINEQHSVLYGPPVISKKRKMIPILLAVLAVLTVVLFFVLRGGISKEGSDKLESSRDKMEQLAPQSNHSPNNSL
jgi:protein phosphatase